MVGINFCGSFIVRIWNALDKFAATNKIHIGSGINRNKKPSDASVTVTTVSYMFFPLKEWLAFALLSYCKNGHFSFWQSFLFSTPPLPSCTCLGRL